jgi:hypothetical protein
MRAASSRLMEGRGALPVLDFRPGVPIAAIPTSSNEFVLAAPKLDRPLCNGLDGIVEAARSNGKPGLRLMLDETRDPTTCRSKEVALQKHY